MTVTKPPPKKAAKPRELPEHLKAYKGVWVFVELERGRVHPVSWELLGEGLVAAETQSGVELRRRDHGTGATAAS